MCGQLGGLLKLLLNRVDLLPGVGDRFLSGGQIVLSHLQFGLNLLQFCLCLSDFAFQVIIGRFLVSFCFRSDGCFLLSSRLRPESIFVFQH